jgi:hypothetical protein
MSRHRRLYGCSARSRVPFAPQATGPGIPGEVPLLVPRSSRATFGAWPGHMARVSSGRQQARAEHRCAGRPQDGLSLIAPVMDGMQEARGSNPLSSTSHFALSAPALGAVCQQIVSRSLPVSSSRSERCPDWTLSSRECPGGPAAKPGRTPDATLTTSSASAGRRRGAATSAASQGVTFAVRTADRDARKPPTRSRARAGCVVTGGRMAAAPSP